MSLVRLVHHGAPGADDAHVSCPSIEKQADWGWDLG